MGSNNSNATLWYAFCAIYFLLFKLILCLHKINFFKLGIEKLNATKYIAKIKSNNEESIKMFEKLRFQKVIILSNYLSSRNNTITSKYDLCCNIGRK